VSFNFGLLCPLIPHGDYFATPSITQTMAPVAFYLVCWPPFATAATAFHILAHNNAHYCTLFVFSISKPANNAFENFPIFWAAIFLLQTGDFSSLRTLHSFAHLFFIFAWRNEKSTCSSAQKKE